VVDGERALVERDGGVEGVAGDEQRVLEAQQRRAQTADDGAFVESIPF
jgi:hypothetical protein